VISPANRFHERMLVSAAKMWKFVRPFKDGHPCATGRACG
jgi:hypothetical protein